MVSALRMMSEELKLCDVIIYVLDSRAPLSCLNPKFDEFISRKPTLFVLNKADLAEPNILSQFRSSDTYRQILQNKPGAVAALTLDSTRSGTSKKVTEAIQNLLHERIKTQAQKGITKTIRAIVIGVTNCGKSTLINNLAAKAKTLAANRPGVTRTKQWVAAADHLWVLDTPGTLWPDLSDQNSHVAKNLAYIGSIKDDILDITVLAKNLIIDLESLVPSSIQTRYNSTNFDEICKNRGYLLKGGAPDAQRAARAILTEFRGGKIGRFNLDKLGTIPFIDLESRAVQEKPVTA